MFVEFQKDGGNNNLNSLVVLEADVALKRWTTTEKPTCLFWQCSGKEAIQAIFDARTSAAIEAKARFGAHGEKDRPLRKARTTDRRTGCRGKVL